MDPLLAFVHHLAAFGAIAAQAVETTTLRGPLDAPRIARLHVTDRVYLATLALVAAAGTARVLAGPKGVAFYTDNPWFWAKIVLVAALGALAIRPARAYRSWHARALREPGWSPSDAEAARVRRAVVGAAHLVVGVLLAATLMARGIGL